MKTLRRLFVLYILSLAMATGLFFINSTVITYTFEDTIFEILFLSIPVLIIVLLLYFINRSIVKRVKGTKKPSS